MYMTSIFVDGHDSLYFVQIYQKVSFLIILNIHRNLLSYTLPLQL